MVKANAKFHRNKKDENEEFLKKLSTPRTFTANINRGYYRVNFLFGKGYFMFITDLHKIAKDLVEACEYQLSRMEHYEDEDK